MTTPDEVLRAMAEASCGNSSRAHAEARIRDALAAAEQAGWVLVPVEPTEEMVRAAYEVGRRWLTDRGKPRAAWGELGSDERWFMRQCARAILACEATVAKP